MARNLDLTALRSFVAVADLGGVTRAARRLNLTQSAVSMQLRRLEESLDAKLLERAGRGVRLTRKGEELSAQARRLLDLNDEIWRRMTRPENDGEITFGVPADIVHPFVPVILKQFSAEFPNVRVKLISSVSSRLMRLMRDGACDIALTTEFDTSAQAELLSRRALVWVGAISGDAWRRRPCPLAFEPECAFRSKTFSALEANGQDWDWVIEASSCDAAMTSVAADLAIGALMKGTAPRDVEEIEHGGALPPLPTLHINLYLNPGPNAELIERFASFVRPAFRDTLTLAERAVA